jgi:hypothetical protein
MSNILGSKKHVRHLNWVPFLPYSKWTKYAFRTLPSTTALTELPASATTNFCRSRIVYGISSCILSVVDNLRVLPVDSVESSLKVSFASNLVYGSLGIKQKQFPDKSASRFVKERLKFISKSNIKTVIPIFIFLYR